MFHLRCGLLALLVLICLAGDAVSTFADDNSASLPVVYMLSINGQQHEIVPGEPLAISGTFEDPTVTLEVVKVRQFQAAGVAFQYPAELKFASDTSDAEVRTWTLSGNKLKVILFQFSGAVRPDELVESTADALEAEVSDSRPIKLQLGDKQHAGVKATLTFASTTLIQQTVSLPETDAGSRILVIQEMRREDEPAGAELPVTLKLIESTLSIQP